MLQRAIETAATFNEASFCQDNLGRFPLNELKVSAGPLKLRMQFQKVHGVSGSL